MHAFDYLGNGDAARAMAVYVNRLRLMNAMTAEDIASIDLTEPFRQRFGNPYAVVHRGDLHGVFVRACQANPLIDLRTACAAAGYEQDGATVTAKLFSGETVTGSVLIGADGLRSRIREQVVGDGAPGVTGHTTYCSPIPTERMADDLRWNAATLWAGPKCHMIHYPLSGWKVFSLVVPMTTTRPGRSPASRCDRLAHLPPRRRSRRAGQRHHVGEDAVPVSRRTHLAVWRR